LPDVLNSPVHDGMCVNDDKFSRILSLQLLMSAVCLCILHTSGILIFTAAPSAREFTFTFVVTRTGLRSPFLLSFVGGTLFCSFVCLSCDNHILQEVHLIPTSIRNSEQLCLRNFAGLLKLCRLAVTMSSVER
jgi:hypothetical protein